MARQSSIDKLPDDVRKRINFLLAEGGMTLDELTDWLDERGHDVSRSALGRHKKKIEDVAKEVRRSQMMAEALVQEVGPGIKDGEQFRMLTQMFQTIVFKEMTDSIEDGMEPKDLHFLARALKDSVSASRVQDEREAKIREEERAAAADRVKDAVQGKGLTAETVKAIEHAVLGVEV